MQFDMVNGIRRDYAVSSEGQRIKEQQCKTHAAEISNTKQMINRKNWGILNIKSLLLSNQSELSASTLCLYLNIWGVFSGPGANLLVFTVFLLVL